MSESPAPDPFLDALSRAGLVTHVLETPVLSDVDGDGTEAAEDAAGPTPAAPVDEDLLIDFLNAQLPPPVLRLGEGRYAFRLDAGDGPEEADFLSALSAELGIPSDAIERLEAEVPATDTGALAERLDGLDSRLAEVARLPDRLPALLAEVLAQDGPQADLAARLDAVQTALAPLAEVSAHLSELARQSADAEATDPIDAVTTGLDTLSARVEAALEVLSGLGDRLSEVLDSRLDALAASLVEEMRAGVEAALAVQAEHHTRRSDAASAVGPFELSDAAAPLVAWQSVLPTASVQLRAPTDRQDDDRLDRIEATQARILAVLEGAAEQSADPDPAPLPDWLPALQDRLEQALSALSDQSQLSDEAPAWLTDLRAQLDELRQGHTAILAALADSSMVDGLASLDQTLASLRLTLGGLSAPPAASGAPSETVQDLRHVLAEFLSQLETRQPVDTGQAKSA